MTNIFDPTWDLEMERGSYRWRRCWIGRRARCEQLGSSLFEVPPGASTFPLHAHHANEELIVMLAGKLVLRTLDGERELTDVAACPAGRRGAHPLDNRSAQPARVLIISTMNAPDINGSPDSGLLWARTYPPGGKPQSDDLEFSGGPEKFDPMSLP